MTAVMVRLRPAVGAISVGGALVAVALTALLVAGLGWHAVGVAALAGVIAMTLLVDVDLPRGGHVPLGHAVILAGAEMLPWGWFVAVAGLGLAVAYPVAHHRDGPQGAIVRVGGTGVATAAAAAAAQLVALLPLEEVADDFRVLTIVAGAGVAFFAADFAVRGRLLARPADRIGASPVLPVYITLLCAAALIGIGASRSAWLAPIAVIPLLVTRFSFRRYAEARRTYAQTVEALSLLPEVARHVPIGHGARTAFYAEALAESIGFDADRVQRVAMAARLHHVGNISLHDPDAQEGPIDHRAVSQTAEEVLRETGFLADLAELVAASQSPGDAPFDAAVIKVCSTLDDVVSAPTRSEADDPFVLVLERHRDGEERRAAIALLHLHERRPELVAEARRATAELVLVAAGRGHHAHVHDHDPTHDCR